MIDWTTAILILAGVVGGIVNAVAGGATLITFPALLATGLNPVAANIANAIAVSPGHLLAVLADRRSLPVLDRHFACYSCFLPPEAWLVPVFCSLFLTAFSPCRFLH